MRAKLDNDWATDEPAYENNGKIEGKPGGMSDNGEQNDKDWWTTRDPASTIWDCDSFAEVKVKVPPNNTEYRSVAYTTFRNPDYTLRHEEKP